MLFSGSLPQDAAKAWSEPEACPLQMSAPAKMNTDMATILQTGESASTAEPFFISGS